jgi:threonylcarbamoyladenosine tRNA methylthiotransferase MtaB
MDHSVRSFSIATLGCKVNRYESEAISEQITDQGWQLENKVTGADLCIVNTCAVTAKACVQSRQAVRRMIRSHPGAAVVVTGCYAQVAPEDFAAMPEVHYIVGNTYKDRIPHLCNRQDNHHGNVTLREELSRPCPFQDLPIIRFGRRTRAFVKIQDGCDAFCAYCIVPYARGPSRSLNPEIAIERIDNLGKQGYSEVVLTGIHIGRYGQDLTPSTSLFDLLCSVEHHRGIDRIRLSSIEPMELSKNLIAHMATSEHLCPHLHIPLQSGDDGILRAMNRPYTAKDYRDLIHHIVHTMPHVAIGVDVMGGFPGETQKAFDNTFRLIEELPVAYLHVFPFSTRKGTAADSLPDHLTPGTIKRRCRDLRKLGQMKRMRFYEKHVGLTREILIEGKRDRTTGLLKGLTRNYIPVLLDGKDALFHRLVRAKIVGIKDGRVYGKRESAKPF